VAAFVAVEAVAPRYGSVGLRRTSGYWIVHMSSFASLPLSIPRNDLRKCLPVRTSPFRASTR